MLSKGKYCPTCKTCRSCDAGKKADKTVKSHDSRKNDSGSSKSMACQLWCSAPDAGATFSTYIGNDNSTTLADIHSKVPYGVEKWSDMIHAKRSLTTRLYNLKNPNCSILSSKVINYFSKCFSYAISKNVGESENLRANLQCIVQHAFGNHAMRDISWCGFEKSPATYKHCDLLNGKVCFLSIPQMSL